MSRVLIAEDGKVGGKCRGVEFPFRSSEDGFEGYARFLHKHAKKSLAIFNPPEVTGVADEEASCLLEPFETGMCFLERYCTLEERVRTHQDP